MAQRIDSPQTGEHITFLTTAGDSDGALLRMEIVMTPGGCVAGEHVHPRQEERFEIVAGRVRMRIDGVERDAIAGDHVVVAPGSRHVWWNPSDEPARVRADLRPALRTQELREVLALWTAQGKTRGGMPVSPLRLAVLAREYRNEVQAAPVNGASTSWLVQSMRNALLIIAAALGRFLGISAVPGGRTPLD